MKINKFIISLVFLFGTLFTNITVFGEEPEQTGNTSISVNAIAETGNTSVSVDAIAETGDTSISINALAETGNIVAPVPTLYGTSGNKEGAPIAPLATSTGENVDKQEIEKANDVILNDISDFEDQKISEEILRIASEDIVNKQIAKEEENSVPEIVLQDTPRGFFSGLWGTIRSILSSDPVFKAQEEIKKIRDIELKMKLGEIDQDSAIKKIDESQKKLARNQERVDEFLSKNPDKTEAVLKDISGILKKGENILTDISNLISEDNKDILEKNNEQIKKQISESQSFKDFNDKKESKKIEKIKKLAEEIKSNPGKLDELKTENPEIFGGLKSKIEEIKKDAEKSKKIENEIKEMGFEGIGGIKEKFKTEIDGLKATGKLEILTPENKEKKILEKIEKLKEVNPEKAAEFKKKFEENKGKMEKVKEDNNLVKLKQEKEKNEEQNKNKEGAPQRENKEVDNKPKEENEGGKLNIESKEAGEEKGILPGEPSPGGLPIPTPEEKIMSGGNIKLEREPLPPISGEVNKIEAQGLSGSIREAQPLPSGNNPRENIPPRPTAPESTPPPPPLAPGSDTPPPPPPAPGTPLR